MSSCKKKSVHVSVSFSRLAAGKTKKLEYAIDAE